MKTTAADYSASGLSISVADKFYLKFTGSVSSTNTSSNRDFQLDDIVITYTPAIGTAYTVTLGDDNTELTEATAGEGVTLPTRDNTGEWTFVGWSESNYTSETTTAPTIIAAGAYIPTANITLYPIYKRTETGGGGTETATIAYSGSSTTNMTGDNDAASVGLSATDWSVTAAKGGSSNYPGLNKDGTIRLYAGGSSDNTDGNEITVTASNSSYTIDKIVVTFNKDANIGTPKLTVDDSEVTATVNSTVYTYTINSSSFTIKNTPSTNTQMHIRQIEITYTNTDGTTTYYTSQPVSDGKKDATVSFTDASKSLTEGDTYTNEISKDPTALVVTFASSDDAVAEVDASTGEVTAVAAGSATITATWAEQDVAGTTYRAGSTSYTVTVTAPVTAEEVTIPYEEAFDSSFGKFTTDGNQAGGSDIWTIDTSHKYAKATSYVNKTNLDGESWLYSPVINLTSATGNVELSFNQCINKYFGTVADEATLWVKEKDATDWTQITITYPTISSTWSSFEEQTVSLNAYKGKKIQVAFKYVGKSSSAGTWEIKEFSVKETTQADPELSFDEATYTATMGSEFTAPTLNNPHSLTVTYSTANDDYATVNPTTGAITLVAPGEVKVTASFAGNEDYKAGEASYQLVVKAAAVMKTFKKITSTDDLTDGEYLIVYENEDGDLIFDGSLSTLDATSNTQEVTIAGDVITTDAGYAFTYDATAKTLKSASGYYIGQTSDANGLASSKTTAYTNTISFDTDGNADVVSSGGAYLRYNATSGQTRFRYYKSSTYTSQKTIQLYKQMEVVSVEITAPAEDSEGDAYATLYYSDKNLKLPTGVVAQTYKVDGQKLVVSKTYNTVIPAGVAVVLKGTPGTESFEVVASTTETADPNSLLAGTDEDEDVTVDSGSLYFVLSLNASQDAGSVGFYFPAGTDGKTNFTNKAHKAYLRVKETDLPAGVKGFSFLDGGETTGIDGLIDNGEFRVDNYDNSIYTLDGRKVSGQLSRGIYVKNGKKFVVK